MKNKNDIESAKCDVGGEVMDELKQAKFFHHMSISY